MTVIKTKKCAAQYEDDPQFEISRK